MLVLPFPAIDPVAVAVGPVAIRWYALAYLAGFIIGWRYCLILASQVAHRPSREDLDDFLTWAVLGVILGGRIGYVLFYNFDQYLAEPLQMLMLWHGGMSFHGGLLGVILVVFLFSWRRGFSPLALGDIIACAVPFGLLFGRIANFINGELYGRPSDVSWAMVFPRDPLQLPRHPSQLYEAFLEGLVLLLVMAGLNYATKLRARPGTLAGIFFIGYALCRITVEFFREPDPQLGFLFAGATMGQLLSLPMIAFGLGLVAWAQLRNRG